MSDIRVMDIDERKKRVQKLVEKFKSNESYYTSDAFVEENVKTQLINPFLECLGWDVTNERGARYNRQDVIMEASEKVEGLNKRPDYLMRISGDNRFYIEAKKASINLYESKSPALQVRRYGYSGKMPIAVLTNFRELAIYNTSIKPKESDTAKKARVEYFTFEQYVDKFEEIYNTISWEATSDGNLDKYLETIDTKKGNETVDIDILKTLELWREKLAEDIAHNNKDMNEHELTSSVQKIIDRILFLRICEDKDIENQYSLKNIINQKTEIYSKLIKVFEDANKKFNAGLFATNKWLNNLIIKDRTLIDIINALYPPESQYDFNIIPVEILGSVYEKFLGKVISFKRNTKNGHSIEIDEKPEVKKAGGVYYTPSYIVKYIVENSIGIKIRDKTPKQVSSMRFVDLACGSGSFLVGAFQYLIDWHLEYYLKDSNKSEKEGLIYIDAVSKRYKLSVEEKKRILLNNIYGVDIDNQAIEVTKLSLFLKLLEDEGRSISNIQIKKLKKGQIALLKGSELHDKILPSMMGNIKCGNSLIGREYYNDKDISSITKEEQLKINIFNWSDEFSEIFMKGGFDCVIGNPPYVRNENMMLNLPKERDAISKSGRYNTLSGKWDLFIPFVEQGLNFLNNNGICSMIVPSALTTASYGKILREKIVTAYNLLEIVDLKDTKVFGNTTGIKNIIFIVQKSKKTESCKISHINQQKIISVSFNQPYSNLIQNGKHNIWNLEYEKCDRDRHSDLNILGDFCYSSKGMVLHSNKKKVGLNIFKKDDLISSIKDDIHCRRYVENKMEYLDKYVIKNTDYLEYNTARCPDKVDRPTFRELFERPKILISKYDELYSVIDDGNDCNDYITCNDALCVDVLWKDLKGVNNKSISAVIKKYSRYSRVEMETLSETINLKYLLGILNSKYANILLKNIRGSDEHIYPEYIRNIPIPQPTKEQLVEMEKLVNQMLTCKKEMLCIKSDTDSKLLTQRINLLEGQINKLTYKLYHLSEGEINSIERII